MTLSEFYLDTVFCCAVRGRSADQAERTQELDRALIQQLRERCEQQNLQLQILQAQLKKASMCLDVFSITTQHFCQKVRQAVGNQANTFSVSCQLQASPALDRLVYHHHTFIHLSTKRL